MEWNGEHSKISGAIKDEVSPFNDWTIFSTEHSYTAAKKPFVVEDFCNMFEHHQRDNNYNIWYTLNGSFYILLIYYCTAIAYLLKGFFYIYLLSFAVFLDPLYSTASMYH